MGCTQAQLNASKKYRDANLEKARAACRNWRARNPERQRAATKSWEARNPGKHEAATKAYRLANPGKTSEWGRNYRKRVPDYSIRRYGVSLSRFIDLAVSQDGKCAICGDQTKLCIDHNHKTGKVRGLLCRKCNAGLGLFKDSALNLFRASAYVKEELLCSE